MAYNPFQAFGQNIATLGQAFKLPELGISEKLSGSATQNQPYSTFGSPVPNYASTGGSTGGMSMGPNMSTQTPWTPVPQGGQVLGTNTGGNGGGTLSGGLPQMDTTGGYNQGQAENNANNQAQIELQQALAEFDKQAELGQNQIGYLEGQQGQTLSDLETMRGRTATEATTAKADAESSTQSEKGKALNTAQGVQKQNRNILRALGILSSSAAGEMLTKPLTEYGQQAAELGMQLVKRKSQVDDWLMQRNQDFDSQTNQIKSQYANLIGNIQTDLRYNGEQRALAVKAASSALQNKLQEISQTAMQYKQAAQEYNNGILGQIAQIQLYQNPNADISGILSSMLNPGQQTAQPQQVGIQQSEEQKKKSLLSGY